MNVKKQLLTDLGVTSTRADRYLPDLNRVFPAHGIDTPLRIAHFLAQVLHESAKMRFVQENLNYSAEALLRVFKKYFTEAEAREYARKPEKIGSRVYANRMDNGPESSGDGFRYRGRGLIQLTGKRNYRKFSQWIDDEDVLTQPDRVAERYAVDSAVYYWRTHDLNALADLDDVKAVTVAINGGVNGLDDRMMLLEKAKAALLRAEPPPALEGATHRVKVTELNLRSQPKVAATTRMGSLFQGTKVARLADAEVADWWRIRTSLSGRLVEGFVASRFLEAIPREIVSEAVVPRALAAPEVEVPSVHLRESRRDVTRYEDGYRAFPLGETGKPRRSGTRPETKARQLGEIVDYLDCENPDHLRCRPKRGTTFCNIYAYDYCYLAGVFLPRVWWTSDALLRIQNGEQVPVAYDRTVRELSANALYNWLLDHGIRFGWRRVFDLDELQAAANNGEVCVIVGQERDANRHGHISMVVPEQADFEADRDATGRVRRPLESQAGRSNHRRVAKSSTWWTRDRFRFSFWRHA